MTMPKYDLLYKAETEIKKGKVLALLGVSYDGPVLYPILIKDKAEALSVFGEKGSLYKAYCRAYDEEPSLQIYLMRVSGSEAEAKLKSIVEVENEDGDIIEEEIDAIDFKTFYGGDKYNEYYINIININIDKYLIINPDDESNKDSIAYNLNNYETIEELVKKINEDMREGLHNVKASSNYMEYETSIITNDDNNHVQFKFGDDGVNISKNDLYYCLDDAYRLLEGFYIDVVCPIDARFDDSFSPGVYGSETYYNKYYSDDTDYLKLSSPINEDFPLTFHGQLIDFCSLQMEAGILTHGVIGLNWIDDIESVSENDYYYLARLLEASAFKNRYDIVEVYNGEEIDYGYFISVTAGDLVYDGTYVENLAVTYAAKICQLDLNSITTTNKIINGASDLQFEMSTEEIIELSNLGVVACRKNAVNEIVITNGVTAAKQSHELSSISDIRRLQFILNGLNEMVLEFIGESSYGIIKNGTLQKVVGDLLKYIQNNNLIIDYTYDIMYNEYEGKALISVDVLTESSFEYINLISGKT